MFDTSKDILYLVIAFCILWVTAFLCWMFYYVTRILRNTNQIIEEFRARLQVLTDTINYIRGKVENIHTLINFATKGVGGLVKNVALKKAKEWINHGSDRMTETAREAVEKAMRMTEKKMRAKKKKENVDKA